ncbi:MAG TPA: nitroreductase family protein [Gemmatimonadales bacterium]|nr:nitroreductase family protein [Gemmatimonadales bacterium]
MTAPVVSHRARAFPELIYERRAVRAYTAETLDEPTIRALLEAAVQAPTAMHLEPWAFVVVQDKAVLKRLSDRAKVIAGEEARHRDLIRAPGTSQLSDPAFNIFYDASTLIVICARALGPFVQADCWLAAENLMLAACAMGLGTCCIGFAIPALRTLEMKHEFGIPPDVTAVAPIIVGRPRGETPPVGRRQPLVLRWIR